MNDTQLETLDQIRQFLEGTEAISFQIESKDARYRWIQHALQAHFMLEIRTSFRLISYWKRLHLDFRQNRLYNNRESLISKC
jgi:hypothetical protein